MIDFIVVGAPRSGTAWIANWLSTESSICQHEPLAHMSHAELHEWHDRRDGIITGFADTSLILNPRYANSFNTKKVLIKRDLNEVSASIRHTFGLEIEPDVYNNFDLIKSDLVVNFDDLFSDCQVAERIYKMCLGRDFDDHAHYRYHMLTKMNIQENMNMFRMDEKAIQEFMSRMQ